MLVALLPPRPRPARPTARRARSDPRGAAPTSPTAARGRCSPRAARVRRRLLSPAGRAGDERLPELRRPPPHLTRGRLVDPQLPFANSPPQACRVRPVLPRGDEVDGRPHQRPLDDRPAFERARQLFAAEVLEARPEPDVRVRRVLILDASIRSSATGMDSVDRSRSSWRASSARFSSRCVSTRSLTGGTRAAARLRPRARRAPPSEAA